MIYVPLNLKISFLFLSIASTSYIPNKISYVYIYNVYTCQMLYVYTYIMFFAAIYHMFISLLTSFT